MNKCSLGIDKTRGKTQKTRTVKESSGTYNVSKSAEKQRKDKIKIRLRDGKEQEIEHNINTLFYADGKPISAQEFSISFCAF